MNVWRWIGMSLFLLVAVCLISTAKLPVYAAVQDKGTDKDAKDKDKDKDAKDKGTKDKDAKDKDAKDKDAKDKDAKDKDTKDKNTKDKDAKDKDAKDKDAKDKDAKDKDAKDKDKDKKEVKVEPPKGDAWKFTAFDKKDKSFYQEQHTSTKQTMTVQGQQVIQEQKQWFLIQWTPKEMKDKNYVVEQQIVGVKMEIDIGGNKIKYDSTDAKKPKNPMTDFFEQLTKQKLTFTITPELKIEKIEGQDLFIKGLSDINPQMQGLLKAILSDKALTKMAEPAWYAFPAEGKVPAKGTWDKVSDLDLGPIGKYKTTFDFTYDGADGKNEKVGIKTKLEYTAPSDKGGLPFVIEKAVLTSESGKGTAVFSREAGRFTSSTLDMTLKGDLTIVVGNMTTVVTLNQTQTATSKTTDDRPAEWAEKK